MLWTPERPISELPDNIAKRFAQYAHGLYMDLQDRTLTVILINQKPPYDPDSSNKIREAASENPLWYQILWGYQGFRRDRTFPSLDRVRNFEDLPYIEGFQRYDAIVRELIMNRLVGGVYENGFEPPDINLGKILDVNPTDPYGEPIERTPVNGNVNEVIDRISDRMFTMGEYFEPDRFGPSADASYVIEVPSYPEDFPEIVGDAIFGRTVDISKFKRNPEDPIDWDILSSDEILEIYKEHASA